MPDSNTPPKQGFTVSHAYKKRFHNIKNVDFFSPTARYETLKKNEEGIKTKKLIAPVTQVHNTIVNDIDPMFKLSAESEFNKHLDAIANNTTHPDFANVKTKSQAIQVLEKDLIHTWHPEELTLFKLRIEALKKELEKDTINNPRVVLEYVQSQYSKINKILEERKEKYLIELRRQLTLLKNAKTIDNKEYDLLEKGFTNSYEQGLKALTDFSTDTPPPKDAKEGTLPTPSLEKKLTQAVDQAEAELLNFVLFSEATKSKGVIPQGLTAATDSLEDDRGRRYRDITFEEYIKDTPFVASSIKDTIKNTIFGAPKNVLYTPSGLVCEYDPHTGAASFTIPTHWLWTDYDTEQFELDMEAICNKLVADGCTELTFNFKTDDPKLKTKLMQEFYIAARLAGVPDEKIKFNITDRKNKDNNIENKNAAEIKSLLGAGTMKKLQFKQQEYEQQKAKIEPKAREETNRKVDALADRIDEIVNLDREVIHARRISP